MKKIDDRQFNSYQDHLGYFKLKPRIPLNYKEIYTEWKENNSVSQPFLYSEKNKKYLQRFIKKCDEFEMSFPKEGLLLDEIYRLKVDNIKSFAQMMLSIKNKKDNNVCNYSKILYSNISIEGKETALQYLHYALNKKNVIEHLFHPELKKIHTNYSAYINNDLEVGVYNKTLRFILDQKKTVNNLILNSKEIKKEVEKELIKINALEWKVEIKNVHKKNLAVNQIKKVIIIPAEYSLYETKLDSIIAHEIHVHVNRAVNGEKSPLNILGVGLPNYIKGEEGIAKYIEIADKEYKLNATFIEVYLGACYIEGELDGSEHDFFETLNFYFDLWKLLHPKKYLQYGDEKAYEYAWKHGFRLFRLTSGQEKGSYYAKDLIYLQGLMDILESLEKNPDEKKRWFLGKYDPSNEQHVNLLNEYCL